MNNSVGPGGVPTGSDDEVKYLPGNASARTEDKEPFWSQVKEEYAYCRERLGHYWGKTRSKARCVCMCALLLGVCVCESCVLVRKSRFAH